MKICSVCGSTKRVYQIDGVLFCNKHYLQMKRHGKILERTIYTPNDFIIKGDTVEIVLYNRQFEEIAIGIVSLRHLDVVNKYKWSLTKEGYMLTYENGKYIYLHRLITNAGADDYVDHINHDTLNNLDDNLRLCTNAQNLQNHTKLQSNNKTGIIGVCWVRSKEKWKAEIQYNKNKVFIGYFTSKEEAIKARTEAEEKYHKEFQSNINIKGEDI